MSGPGRSRARPPRGIGDWLVVAAAVLALGLIVILPLVVVLHGATAKGFGALAKAIVDAETMSAAKLTLFVAIVVVPLNLGFGLAAAWLLARYDFRGRNLLVTLVDLPFSVSPVISGLVFVLLFGAQGWLGPTLAHNDIRIIFAVPGIVLATTFVTLPMIARELLAVMEAQGAQEEEAALTLGAGLWTILWRITLPKVRWGLLYGIVLCNARAMGEFGAVSVVSGHIRGETNTLPLHIEILYNEYDFVAAFAVASLLAMLALATVAAKRLLQWFARPKAVRA
jgi:sulfate transport system permease protein